MFGNVVYYDKKKIDEYSSLIRGCRNFEIDEYEVSNDKAIQIGLKVLGGDAKSSKSYKAKIQESQLYSCDEFEKLLYGRDDYYDFTLSPDFDLTSMSRGTIIKFDGYMKVPEEFDLTQTIEKFKPMLISSIMEGDINESEQAALNVFLQMPNTKIPVLLDFEEHLMCAKLVSSNMLIQYEDMEELEELEVTVVARLISGNAVSVKKAFYDPLKDFMTLNRMMRRSIDGRTEGINEIYADRDYRTVEVLAIYQ